MFVLCCCSVKELIDAERCSSRGTWETQTHRKHVEKLITSSAWMLDPESGGGVKRTSRFFHLLGDNFSLATGNTTQLCPWCLSPSSTRSSLKRLAAPARPEPRACWDRGTRSCPALSASTWITHSTEGTRTDIYKRQTSKQCRSWSLSPLHSSHMSNLLNC